MGGTVVGVETEVMVMAIVLSVVLLFMGVGILVLLHVCIMRRAFRTAITSSNAVDRSNIMSRSMLREDVEKLPCFDFKAGEKGSSGTSSPMDCAVCLENFAVGDRCRLLPICKHSFHVECVDSWLLKTPICPICRTKVSIRKRSVVLGDEEEGDSGEDVSLFGTQLNPDIDILPVSDSPSEPAV